MPDPRFADVCAADELAFIRWLNSGGEQVHKFIVRHLFSGSWSIFTPCIHFLLYCTVSISISYLNSLSTVHSHHFQDVSPLTSSRRRLSFPSHNAISNRSIHDDWTWYRRSITSRSNWCRGRLFCRNSKIWKCSTITITLYRIWSWKRRWRLSWDVYARFNSKVSKVGREKNISIRKIEKPSN